MQFCEKIKISRKGFRWMIFYDFSKGLNQQQCVELLRSIFGNKASNMIEKERRVIYSELQMTAVHLILYENLGVKKICFRWILHNLTEA